MMGGKGPYRILPMTRARDATQALCSALVSFFLEPSHFPPLLFRRLWFSLFWFGGCGCVCCWLLQERLEGLKKVWCNWSEAKGAFQTAHSRRASHAIASGNASSCAENAKFHEFLNHVPGKVQLLIELLDKRYVYRLRVVVEVYDIPNKAKWGSLR